MDVLPDFPHGPLDSYRKQASFDWKKLKIRVEGEDMVQLKMKIWKTLESDPLFAHIPETLKLDKYRHLNTLRTQRVYDYMFVEKGEILPEPRKEMTLCEALNAYDPSLLLKYGIPVNFFPMSVRGSGTIEQQSIVRKALMQDVSACLALTEISHGTNAKQMRTVATFDPATQEFILNSPDFEAAKCWVGGLGKSCTHATVYSQLITPDGVNQGLHGFFIPLRDPKTMKTYPGVVIGDMGEKLGYNAVDNGFAVFTNYRVAKDCLLSRFADVTSNGEYRTTIKDPRKRFGALLIALSGGRALVLNISHVNLLKAVVIAIRYSAVRKQFGPTEEEQAVIEYQLQQWVLFPYLAATYVLKLFSQHVYDGLFQFIVMQATGQDKAETSAFGAELHALLCAAKPMSSSLAQSGIQECREACGGHGYLKCAGFGVLRDDNDGNCTFDGVKHVLMQQTSNWLLQVWEKHKNNVKTNSPLKSLIFLDPELRRKNVVVHNVQQLLDPEVILSLYGQLIPWLLQSTQEIFESHKRAGKDSFTARNDSQVFAARDVAFAFLEHAMIQHFWDFIKEEVPELELKDVLTKLCALYGLWSLEKHLGTLFEAQIIKDPSVPKLIKRGILLLCSELKSDAVALVDALAPPDFILNSVLGNSDGQVYNNLQAFLYQTPKVFERPEWWKEMVKGYRSRL